MSELNTNTTPVEGEAKVEAAAAKADTGTTAKLPFGDVDFTVPEAFRSFAETVVLQTREAYERSKDALEESVETLEASIDKTGQGIAAINRKAIDIAQANLNSGLDHVKALAGARNPAELIELQSDFVRKQFETFAAQAKEFGELSKKVADDTAEPVKSYVQRSLETLKTH
ncbi:MAG: hypothetical protein Kow0032_04810 [Methyloligellaceae bacterium]